MRASLLIHCGDQGSLFPVTTPGSVDERDRKRISPNVQVTTYMERNHIALLLAVGIAAGLYGAVTYQWILMLVIVAVVALILVASDVAGRIGA
ncbi:hypothetical protein Memar_0114 [Methanoculleus marisnigri JR1]|uniref:Uncharacterized protein n=2 Tax=Methanoculleus TaxID=45989 RepID=A3CRP9_METMJ|nr:hypothetical protein Memar_0114 [Methanoculleus marisnigri JR1]